MPRTLAQPPLGHWVIFEHSMPFDIARAYDEAHGHVDPRSGPRSATSDVAVAPA